MVKSEKTYQSRSIKFLFPGVDLLLAFDIFEFQWTVSSSVCRAQVSALPPVRLQKHTILLGSHLLSGNGFPRVPDKRKPHKAEVS